MKIEALLLHLEINQVFEKHGASPETDAALARCEDAECRLCSALICPDGDPMHFHHDGCPSCAEKEDIGTCPWCGMTGMGFAESDPPSDYCGHDPAPVRSK